MDDEKITMLHGAFNNKTKLTLDELKGWINSLHDETCKDTKFQLLIIEKVDNGEK